MENKAGIAIALKNLDTHTHTVTWESQLEISNEYF